MRDSELLKSAKILTWKETHLTGANIVNIMCYITYDKVSKFKSSEQGNSISLKEILFSLIICQDRKQECLNTTVIVNKYAIN